jgi:hypothetical protein
MDATPLWYWTAAVGTLEPRLNQQQHLRELSLVSAICECTIFSTVQVTHPGDQGGQGCCYGSIPNGSPIFSRLP